MSDTSTPTSEELDSSTEGEGAPDGETKAKAKVEYVPKSELDDAARRRQRALEEKRAAQAEAAELREQLNQLKQRETEFESLKRKAEDDEAEKRGDIERLRKSASERESELQGRISSLEAELAKVREDSASEVSSLKSTYLLEAEVMRVLSEVTTDPELVWLALGHRFELAEDEKTGRLRPRPKDSTLDLKTFVERELETANRAVLLKTKRRSGADSQQSEKGTMNGLTPDQITNSADRGKELFNKDVEAARKFLSQAKIMG